VKSLKELVARTEEGKYLLSIQGINYLSTTTEAMHQCTDIGISVKSYANLKNGFWRKFVSLIPI
jgi:hypothetical protein